MHQVIYEDGQLVIRIPTSSPASLHSRILKAISVALRLSMLSREQRKQDMEQLTTIIDLQDAITPQEDTLMRIAC